MHQALIKFQRLRHKDIKDTILDLGKLIGLVEETDAQVNLT